MGSLTFGEEEDFNVTVTGLIQSTQKTFSSTMTVRGVTESIQDTNLTLTGTCQLEYEGKILDNPDQRLADVVRRMKPMLHCINGIPVQTFSERQTDRSEVIAWEGDSAADFLSRLQRLPGVRHVVDAVVCESGIRLAECEGPAMQFLREQCEVKLIEDVFQVSVRIASSVVERAKPSRTIFMSLNETSANIESELGLNPFSMIILEGRKVGGRCFRAHETEDKSVVFLDHAGSACPPGQVRYHKYMEIVVANIPRPNSNGKPLLTAIDGLKFYVLSDQLISEKNTFPNAHLNYRVMLYGVSVRKVISRTPTLYFRSEDGYMTIYDDNHVANKKDFAKMRSRASPFLLFIEDDEAVTDELAAKPSKSCTKIKVWIFYDNVWLQRLIPFKSCRHFIPK